MSTDASTNAEQLVGEVHQRYTEAAQAARDGQSACCGPTEVAAFGASRYADISPGDMPDQALLASLGCGNPTAVAELAVGECVLDLGCGGGIDLILSARRVGRTGKVYGLDFLDEMLLLARDNLRTADVSNVELLKGRIEQIPLPAQTVDVVISNCVINLSVDKQAVFGEVARVLRPGGRLGISDVVAEDRLSPAERAERGGYAECIAGALSFGEYHQVLAAAGFTDISVEPTHEVADGLHGAIIKARASTSTPVRQQPEPSTGCCG